MEAAALQLVLPSGDSEGVIIAEMQDWSGQVLILPRDAVSGVLVGVDLYCPGVYILVGENQSDFLRDYVYVGESESIATRIKQHLKSKDKNFWRRVIVLKSKSGNLNKAHVRYMESRLLAEIQSADVVAVSNQNKKLAENHLTPYDRINADIYINRLKIIMKCLGVNYFSKKSPLGLKGQESETPTVLNYSNPIFEIRTVGAHAFGRRVGDSFVVAKGSTLRHLSSGPYATHVQQMVSRGVLKFHEGPIYSFVRDVAFTSVSLAASIIAGTQRSGYASWKILSTKTTMRQWEESMNEVFGFDFDYSQLETVSVYVGKSINFDEL